jgi:transcriptional regulator with XRE-family HTH domain
MANLEFRQGIASAIRALRAERRWTQRELCRQTELSPAYLSELESGQKDASADVLLRIASAFGYEMDEFLWTALLAMIHGEVPNAERRATVLKLTRLLLDAGPQSRAEIEEFLDYQAWKRSRKNPAARRPSHTAATPKPNASDQTTPDFTEDV